MIPAYVKYLGDTSNKTAGTTLGQVLQGGGSAAGNLIVARVIFDNAATASKPIVSSISKMAGETEQLGLPRCRSLHLHLCRCVRLRRDVVHPDNGGVDRDDHRHAGHLGHAESRADAGVLRGAGTAPQHGRNGLLDHDHCGLGHYDRHCTSHQRPRHRSDLRVERRRSTGR